MKNNYNKQRKYSLRKSKVYGLTLAVIGVISFGSAVNSVSADVITNIDNTTAMSSDNEDSSTENITNSNVTNEGDVLATVDNTTISNVTNNDSVSNSNITDIAVSSDNESLNSISPVTEGIVDSSTDIPIKNIESLNSVTPVSESAIETSTDSTSLDVLDAKDYNIDNLISSSAVDTSSDISSNSREISDDVSTADELIRLSIL